MNEFNNEAFNAVVTVSTLSTKVLDELYQGRTSSVELEVGDYTMTITTRKRRAKRATTARKKVAKTATKTARKKTATATTRRTRK